MVDDCIGKTEICLEHFPEFPKDGVLKPYITEVVHLEEETDDIYEEDMHTMYMTIKDGFARHRGEAMARSFQDVAIGMILEKATRAAEDYHVKQMVLAGGVSANSYLREQMKARLEGTGIDLIIPPLWCTTDNAAMVLRTAIPNKPIRTKRITKIMTRAIKARLSFSDISIVAKIGRKRFIFYPPNWCRSHRKDSLAFAAGESDWVVAYRRVAAESAQAVGVGVDRLQDCLKVAKRIEAAAQSECRSAAGRRQESVGHEKFGEGEVLSIIDNSIIVVNFISCGKKTLLANHPMLSRKASKGGQA